LRFAPGQERILASTTPACRLHTLRRLARRRSTAPLRVRCPRGPTSVRRQQSLTDCCLRVLLQISLAQKDIQSRHFTHSGPSSQVDLRPGVHDRSCGPRWKPEDWSRSCTPDRPAGTADHSPPFQRWVPRSEITPSPARGERRPRQAECVLSSLPGLLCSLPRFPSDKSLGYDLSPFGLGWSRRGNTRTVMHPLPPFGLTLMSLRGAQRRGNLGSQTRFIAFGDPLNPVGWEIASLAMTYRQVPSIDFVFVLAVGALGLTVGRAGR
jgi:hypothetical protein